MWKLFFCQLVQKAKTTFYVVFIPRSLFSCQGWLQVFGWSRCEEENMHAKKNIAQGFVFIILSLTETVLFWISFRMLNLEGWDVLVDSITWEAKWNTKNMYRKRKHLLFFSSLHWKKNFLIPVISHIRRRNRWKSPTILYNICDKRRKCFLVMHPTIFQLKNIFLNIG